MNHTNADTNAKSMPNMTSMTSIANSYTPVGSSYTPVGSSYTPVGNETTRDARAIRNTDHVAALTESIVVGTEINTAIRTTIDTAIKTHSRGTKAPGEAGDRRGTERLVAWERVGFGSLGR